ncbi:PLP-dependent transferase [Klebsiella pneumoniae subsp. pneumoniae]|nr:PLP-dependent transferase [Klebsiella pneumoniae subsp. pneumoniae]
MYATPSTFAQPAPGQHTGYEYSRSRNPTATRWRRRSPTWKKRHARLRVRLRAGRHLHRAGADWIRTVTWWRSMMCMRGTYRLLENVRRRSAWSAGELGETRRPGGRLKRRSAPAPASRVETPTNPLLKLADLSAIAAIARRH